MFLVLSDHNNVIERSSDISRSTFSSVCVLYALFSWSLTCNLHLVVRFNESSGSNLSKIGLLSDFFGDSGCARNSRGSRCSLEPALGGPVSTSSAGIALLC